MPPNFWRDSLATASLHGCSLDAVGASTCLGSDHSAYRISPENEGRYCSEGHTGPRCDDCTAPNHYFAESARRCEACPTSKRFVVLCGVVLGVVALLAFFHRFAKQFHAYRRRTGRLGVGAAKISLQAKLKILLSFYQVATSLGPVYGVQLDSRFTSWLDVLEVFNVDAVDLTYPGSCFGSMRERLLLNALWPYGAITLVLALIAVQGAVSYFRAPAAPRKTSLATIVLQRSLYAAVLIVYLVLPGVSRSIFKAQQCVSYNSNDSLGTRRSYLIADLSVQCNAAEDQNFASLSAYVWSFFALWPMLVPLGFLLLLI